MWKKLWTLAMVCLLAAMGVVCYAGLIALVYHWEVSVPQATEYDGIIVLGAQVQPSGEPSVQLQWRLEKAAEYYGIVKENAKEDSEEYAQAVAALEKL